MSDDILDLIKGGPGNHRIVARRASRLFDDSQRFVVKALKNVHNYKGHEMGTRPNGRIVIVAYGNEFEDMDAAHAWIDEHVEAETTSSHGGRQ
jgi:hypothetical protein